MKEEAKKTKRYRKSESASTSPDVRHRENGVGSMMKTNETCNGKDVNENIQENSKGDFEDTTNQEMTESNPAFLKYLQFKVHIIFAEYFFSMNMHVHENWTLNIQIIFDKEKCFS